MIRRRLFSWRAHRRGLRRRRGAARRRRSSGLTLPAAVEAREEVAGGDVGRDLQRPAEEAAEDHLGAGVGAVQGAAGDADQLREFGRVGFGGEGDDVLLVPDLPAADRQEGQFRVVLPRMRLRARSGGPLRAGSSSRPSAARRSSPAGRSPAAPTHSGEPQTKGKTRIPASAASSTSRSKPDQSGSATVSGLSGSIPDQYSGSRTLVDPGFAHQLEVRVVERALRRDPDEAGRQIGLRRRRQRHRAPPPAPRSAGSCASSPTGTAASPQSSGRRRRQGGDRLVPAL